MSLKNGDKVLMAPRDDQHTWKDAKGRTLVGRVGRITDGDKEYDNGSEVYHGYCVTFGTQGPYVIEARHLISVDEYYAIDEDTLGCEEPDTYASWKDSVWKPVQIKVAKS